MWPPLLWCHIQPVRLFQTLFLSYESERRKKLPKLSLWDTLILIKTGGSLLQTGQFFLIPLKDARPSLKEMLLHGNMLLENQKHTLNSGRSYSPGPAKKTFSAAFCSFTCLWLIQSHWLLKHLHRSLSSEGPVSSLFTYTCSDLIFSHKVGNGAATCFATPKDFRLTRYMSVYM